MRYLIIGNGVAAVSCAEAIRERDADGEITLLSEEMHPAYCRPLISYLLERKTDREKMLYRPADFYEKLRCRVEYGVRAVKIEPAAHTVTAGDGSVHPYDRLCVATGSSPFVPPIEGLAGVRARYGFLTLDDALALDQAALAGSRVLIVGAGLIGLKCAEGLHGRVKSITVCDLSDRVLSSILDIQDAKPVEEHLCAQGIELLLGDSAVSFSPGYAVMKSGIRVPFDLLVTAVGVRPNAALVREAGGECGRGIMVDEAGRTSLPDVFAAGDCTESRDTSDGKQKVMALMPNACIQGRAAGIAMAGGEPGPSPLIPMNSLGLLGLHIMTAGSRPSAEEGGSEESVRTESGLRRFFLRGNRLVGFVLIGDVARAGIYTDLIRTGRELTEEEFSFLKKNPELRAFDGKTRRNRLGGVV